MKPILTLDFDGVIHSYTSGWRGATVIPDPPVPGALEFIVAAINPFQVAILSSRSHQWGGRRAMKRYLRKHLTALAGNDFSEAPEWWRNKISESAFADPWCDEVDWAITHVVRAISWPLFKPSSMVTIDDRAITFTGQWPTVTSLMGFRPWNKPAPNVQIPIKKRLQ